MSVARWFFSMLEEKQDAHRRLSMTRCAVAAVTTVLCIRLLGLGPLGWPDAVVAFFTLFALPIDKALRGASPETVVEAVTGMFGQGESSGPASYRRTSSIAVEQGAGVLSGRDLEPPVSRGRPEPENES